MKLLRKYIRETLRRTASILPVGNYRFPIVPYPQSGSEEGLRDLEHVVFQYSNRLVPDEFQDSSNKDMDGLFEDHLSSKGVTYNVGYYTKLRKDLAPIITALKEFYNRRRPSEEARHLGTPLRFDTLGSAKSPSYPSGHTIQAYVIALLLANQFPQETEGLLRVAEMISQSRIDRGVHFPSDVDFGREIAYLIVKEMLNEPTA